MVSSSFSGCQLCVESLMLLLFPSACSCCCPSDWCSADVDFHL